MKTFLTTVTFLAATLVASSFAEDTVKPYPLKKCIISGEPLDADAVKVVYEGQEMKFCCKKCAKKFNVSPAKYVEEVKVAAK